MATTTPEPPSAPKDAPTVTPVPPNRDPKPAAASGSKPASASGSVPSPGVSESVLVQAIVRRGLATPNEVEACKAHRDKVKPANKGDSRSLLEVMIAAKAMTTNQSSRLLKELAAESPKALTIPGYEIIGPLGRGSMGMVYKARQVSMDRIVAVKSLLESLASNTDFIKRFEREAKVAAKLSHNNIVNAYDAGEFDGRHYFVMEYVEGTSVKDELVKRKVFEEKDGLEIILAVTEALKHAHEKGLVHRDIKPDNIILTKQGVVKLADLGLARPTGDEKRAAAEAGMAIGTPYYMSPEQVRGQTDVDIRADIYSLGATFYHMMTGRVPFEGTTPTEVMKKHIDKNLELTPADHLNTRISSGLGVVIETMMSRDRDARYQNPDDLILDLKCLIQGERPVIAEQKADALAALAEGDISDDAAGFATVSDSRLEEMAAYVNSRLTIIIVLSILLAISAATNLILLAKH